MLDDAIRENPNSFILIKTHPDAITGGEDRVCLLRENLNQISLLQAVDKVYVVSSQMGMEGLICGKQASSSTSSLFGERGDEVGSVAFGRKLYKLR